MSEPTPAEVLTARRAARTHVVIDGVTLAIVAREPAQQETPLNPGKLVPMTHVDKLLLEDGREVYQCVKLDDCEYCNEKPFSVRAHLTRHSAVIAQRRAEATADAVADNARTAAAIGREAMAERRALLAENGLDGYLLGLAMDLEQAIPYLREISRQIVKRGPEVTAEELEELREKAARWDGIMAQLAPVKKKGGRG